MGNRRLGSNASTLLVLWEMSSCKTEIVGVLPLSEKVDGKKRKADPGGPGLEGLTGGRHMLSVACELNRKGVKGSMGGGLGSGRGALVNSSAGPAAVSRGVGVAREPRGGLQVSHHEQVRYRGALCAVGEDQGKGRWGGRGRCSRGKGPKED